MISSIFQLADFAALAFMIERAAHFNEYLPHAIVVMRCHY